MANEEHLARLKKGIEVWNQWRKENRDVKPDLTEAHLRGANLSLANLSGVDLREANLRGANFLRANLSGADLTEADLSAAYLRGAHLRGANLSLANLSGVDLREANLRGANFLRADLREADLREADLREADLNWANLSGADLGMADLRGADFSGAGSIPTDLRGANLSGADFSLEKLIGLDLTGVNLSGADFSGVDFNSKDLSRTNLTEVNFIEANLTGVNLNEANLQNANLSEANLSRIQALGTNFTRANFTGVCIEDWHTNSATNLTDVICDYIYLKENQQERRPSSGNFQPGEFTKIFQKSLETVDLIFRNGIDWDAFAYSFKKVEFENSGAKLDVQSIEKKKDGVLLVRVAVSPEADKEKIHSEFVQGYEFARKALEAQYQAQLEDKEKMINQLFSTINQLSETPKKVSNYYLNQSQIAGGIVDAEIVKTHQIGGNIHNTDNQDGLD